MQGIVHATAREGIERIFMCFFLTLRRKKFNDFTGCRMRIKKFVIQLYAKFFGDDLELVADTLVVAKFAASSENSSLTWQNLELVEQSRASRIVDQLNKSSDPSEDVLSGSKSSG